MGTHHFDGSGKELLRRDRSVGAALAKRGVTKASSGSVAFGASFATMSVVSWRAPAVVAWLLAYRPDFGFPPPIEPVFLFV